MHKAISELFLSHSFTESTVCGRLPVLVTLYGRCKARLLTRSFQTGCSAPFGNLILGATHGSCPPTWQCWRKLPASFRINLKLLTLPSRWPTWPYLPLLPLPSPSPFHPPEPSWTFSIPQTSPATACFRLFGSVFPPSRKFLSGCDKHFCHLFSPVHPRDLVTIVMSIMDVGSDFLIGLPSNVVQALLCTNRAQASCSPGHLNFTVLGVGREF